MNWCGSAFRLAIDGVSRRRRWALGVLLLALPCLVQAQSVALPDMGDSSAGALSTAQANRIGAEMMRQLRSRQLLLNDQVVAQYIESLGQNLASFTGDVERDYTFFVMNDGSINAFAAPGGYVGVNAGLIRAARTESELASVIAHEIAHVKQRHLERATEAASGMQIPLAAAVLAAIFLGGSVDVTEAALATAIAGTQQAQINFTRSNEREADRLGMQLLAEAGYDPAGMAAFFEKLQRASSLYGGEVYEFLQTHPITTDRIAEARDRATRYATSRRLDSDTFELVRERIQVLMADDPGTAVAQFTKALQETPESLPLRYGLTVAHLRAAHWNEALIEARALVRQRPETVLFCMALAEARRGAGEVKGALEALSGMLDLYPAHRPLRLLESELRIQGGDPSTARKVLLDLVRQRGDDPIAFQLLATAVSKLGEERLAHYYLAQQQYALGNRSEALRQVENGLKLDGASSYESALLTALRDQLREEAARLPKPERPKEGH